jgi:hypothetical protein
VGIGVVPKRVYYAENLPQLRRITNAYDPDRLLDAGTSSPGDPVRSVDA